MAMIDIFLKIDGIEGESTDIKHPRELQLESFGWGVQQPPSISTTETTLSTRTPRPKATFQDFAFRHRIDKASPMLVMACAMGTRIPSAVMVARTAGAQPLEFLKIVLTDVFVSSVALDTAGGDTVPVESVTFRYGKVEMEYRGRKPDGSADAPVTATCKVE